MMNKDKLDAAGIDYAGGVHRFAGSAQIYEKYLRKFFDKDDMPVLRRALEDGDYDAAFRVAHNIKGGAGNLGVTAYYSTICKLVDALRAGVRDGSLLTLCGEAEKFYRTAQSAVKE